MTSPSKILSHNYFPGNSQDVPFGEMLNKVFFDPSKDIVDFSIHGPNVVRFTLAILQKKLLTEKGLLKGGKKDKELIADKFSDIHPEIKKQLDVNNIAEYQNITTLLSLAAVYHDIGKSIRNANHPQIGANLIRYFKEEEREKLVNILGYSNDGKNNLESRQNRFSLIASIIQHHDKFGVVSTGEAALSIFSDILYFKSDKNCLAGIKKNVTSVMLVNLADIAAVAGVADDADKKEAYAIAQALAQVRGIAVDDVRSDLAKLSEGQLIKKLLNICKKDESSLGLTKEKFFDVIEDWSILVEKIDQNSRHLSREKLKVALLEHEGNPDRAIKRMLRLFIASANSSKAHCLTDCVSLTTMEMSLVGILGAHEFEKFCKQLATVVKFDYALKFFQTILCACVRKELKDKDWREKPFKTLGPDEVKLLNQMSSEAKIKLTRKISILFVRVVAAFINRYVSIFDSNSKNPQRFCFQLGELTRDEHVRNSIVDLLCFQEAKEHFGLMWIVDEISIVSMD